jgi:transposase
VTGKRHIRLVGAGPSCGGRLPLHLGPGFRRVLPLGLASFSTTAPGVTEARWRGGGANMAARGQRCGAMSRRAAVVIVVGVDTHKATHTLVGADAGGRQLGELTVRATSAGHLKALGWARELFGADLVWGVEDCRTLSSRLERELLDAGQKVVRVPPHLMARTRASARTRGKSDAIDALAVARAVLREPDLPVASHDEVSRELKLLVDRREDLVVHRTAMINRLLWRVHELDPSHAPKPRSLDRVSTGQVLGAWLAAQPGLVALLASR